MPTTEAVTEHEQHWPLAPLECELECRTLVVQASLSRTFAANGRGPRASTAI